MVEVVEIVLLMMVVIHANIFESLAFLIVDFCLDGDLDSISSAIRR
jgi:hypothetical protein